MRVTVDDEGRVRALEIYARGADGSAPRWRSLDEGMTIHHQRGANEIVRACVYVKHLNGGTPEFECVKLTDESGSVIYALSGDGGRVRSPLYTNGSLHLQLRAAGREFQGDFDIVLVDDDSIDPDPVPIVIPTDPQSLTG